MPRRLRKVHQFLFLSSLIATLVAARASQPIWAGNGGSGNGNGSNSSNWSLPPTASQVAQVATGNMFVDTALTFGALEFSGGTISGANSLTLGNSTLTSSWTGGDFDGPTINILGLTIGAGSTKRVKNSALLNLQGATQWTGDTIATSAAGSLNNAGTFTTNFDGTISFDSTGTRGTFTNNGTFTKSAGAGGATEVQTVFNNSSAGVVNVGAGKLKLSGGGSSAGTVNVSTGAALQISGNYSFSGGNFTGAGTVDVTAGVTTFSGTAGGNTSLQVSGGEAKFDSAHETSGKLTLASGNVSGTGNATVGSFEWTGGALGAKVRSTGNTTISSNTTLSLTNELTLAGNTTWDGTQISGSGSAKIANESGKTFSATGDGIISGGSNIVFTNAGTFEKSSGNVTSTNIQTRFENSGEIKASAGTLKLSGGGNSSNTVTIGNGAKLEIDGTDFAFTGGAINGSTGKLQLSGNTTTFTSTTSGDAELAVNGGTASFNGTHSGTGKLSLASGTVTGNGTAKFGSLDWSGGTLGGNVTSNGSTTIGTGSKTLAGELTLAGDTSWSGGTISTSAGAKIKNESGKNFTVSGSGILANGGSGSFENAGTFGQSGSGSTDVQVSITNTGTINAGGGTVKLSGGGTSAGNIVLGTGGKLQINGKDFTFNGGSINGAAGKLEVAGNTTTFTGTTIGDGEIAVAGGTVNFNGTHNGSGRLSLASGLVSGTGTATFASLDWSGGTLGGNITSNATTLGAGTKTLAGELTLNSDTAWSGGSINGSGSAKIKNQSGKTFTANGSGTVTNGVTFANDGIFEKLGASGDATDIQSAFVSTGQIKATGGTLKLSGGGSSSNTVTIGGGAKLEIGGADFAVTGGAIGGSGKLQLSGNTTTFTNATSGDAEFAVSGGTAKFDGAHVGTGKLSLSSGAVSGNGTATFGAFDWTGGALNAKVTATGTTTINGSARNLGGELTLSGNTSWDGGGIATGTGAKIRNEAGKTFNATSDAAITGTGTFTNAGTFQKSSGAAGSATEIQVGFDNSGALNVSAGRLRLTGGGTSTGSVTINGALEVSGGNYAFNGSTLNGAGALELTGATTTFTGVSGNAQVKLTGGNAAFNASQSSLGKLTLATGAVSTTNGGSVNASTFEWNGGSLNGRLQSSGSTFAGGSKSLATGAELLLGGSTSWDGSTITAAGTARIQNQNGATFVANADGILANTGSGVFANNGTFSKGSGAGGTTQVQLRFENSGVVNVNSGKLELRGGGVNAANASIVVASAATLDLVGGATDFSLLTGSSLSGNGTARLLSGSFSAQGNVTIKNFSFEGGSLAGTNTFTGAVEWNAGDWNSTAAGMSTVIAAGGVLNLRNANSHDFNNRSILNEGTVNWYAGNLRGGNGGTFTNNSIFNDLSGTNRSFGTQAGASGFINNGEYRKAAGGTTTMEVPFTNNGALKVSSGSILFASTYAGSGPITLTNGASAQFANAVSFASGTQLSGSGTIAAPSVTSAGSISPGQSPGQLNVTGNLTLLSTSKLLIELGGPAQGTGYDFLSVSGTTLVGGTLQVTFQNGYQWSVKPTDTFTILTAGGGLAGTFANPVLSDGRIASFDGAATFKVNYGLNSVSLSEFVVAVPEPSTYAMFGIGAAIVLLRFRRRK